MNIHCKSVELFNQFRTNFLAIKCSTMGNTVAKVVKKVGKYGLAVLLGYQTNKDLNEIPQNQAPKVDVNDVKQIIHNIIEMKQENEKGPSATEIAMFIFLFLIFVAILIGIIMFCCFKIKSSSAKKAVENYKQNIANK